MGKASGGGEYGMSGGVTGGSKVEADFEKRQQQIRSGITSISCHKRPLQRSELQKEGRSCFQNSRGRLGFQMDLKWDGNNGGTDRSWFSNRYWERVGPGYSVGPRYIKGAGGLKVIWPSGWDVRKGWPLIRPGGGLGGNYKVGPSNKKRAVGLNVSGPSGWANFKDSMVSPEKDC